MIISGTIIKPDGPVNLRELQTLLGTTESSVCGICRSPAINRYARCKPYAFGGILPSGITEAVRLSGNYGMTPALLTIPPASDITDTSGCTTPWEQWRPPGGLRADNEPCRLGDFRGYDHAAKADIEAVEFFNQWSEGTAMALNDGYTGVRVRFAPGYDFRVGLDCFSYGGTELSQMYLTLLVANKGASKWALHCAAAQSEQPLGGLDRTQTRTWEVRLDLPSMSDADAMEWLQFGSDRYSDENLVIAGLSPKFDGIDVGTTALLRTDGVLPVMVSLDMWAQGMKLVHHNLQLVGKDYYGTAQKETFDVRGYLTVTQNAQRGQTKAAYATDANGRQGVAVEIGGQFDLYPYEENRRTEGMMLLQFDVWVSDADGGAEYGESFGNLVAATPGIGERSIAMSGNGASGDTVNVPEGANIALNGQPLPRSLFIPFSGQKAQVLVQCSVSGYGTVGADGRIYTPRMVDAGSASQSWSREIFNDTIIKP